MSESEVVAMLKQGLTITNIAGKLSVSRSTLHSRMKEWNVHSKLERFDHLFFKFIDTEAKAYWLGFVMADGCVSVSQNPKVLICIKKEDENHLIAWHKAIKSSNRLSHKSNGMVSSAHYSKIMCDDLINLGCTPRKSLTLQFPSVPSRLLHHFVRGYFDGDGCASWHNRNQKTKQLRLSFIGTHSFMERIQIAVGVKNKILPKGRAWMFQVGGNRQCKRICEWMYKNASIYLTRKKEVCHSLLRLRLWKVRIPRRVSPRNVPNQKVQMSRMWTQIS